VAATSARSEAAVSVVQALVQRMDFEAQVSLVREDEQEIHVHITGKDEKRAIGQRGEVLLSLQFLANRLLGRAEQENEADQVLVLDAGGHRQRRQAAIEALARALSERAVAEGKAVRLSPMSAHDRRIFHVALEGNDAVVTQSEGDGPMRNLLIVPSVFVR
jgi:spoIIIJ-associated protein